MKSLPPLTPLVSLNLADLPPGTSVECAFDGTVFYRASWLLCQCDGQICYVGDHEAAHDLQRLAALEQEIAKLLVEKQQLQAALLPTAPSTPHTPATWAKQPKRVKPKTRATTLVRCAVDGCEIELASGTSIAMHRQRIHGDWFKRQSALPDDHPLKVVRTGAILLWEAAQTEHLPALQELPAPEVAQEHAIPFTPA